MAHVHEEDWLGESRRPPAHWLRVALVVFLLFGMALTLVVGARLLIL